MAVDEARSRIALARGHLQRVQSAAWEPDAENAITWAFYVYEVCVTALAELHSLEWSPNHLHKARLARRLHGEGRISRDISDLLGELNRLRKDVAYEGAGPELEEIDLEGLASELQEFIRKLSPA